MQVRIWHDGRLWVDRGVCAGAGVGVEPGRCVRVGNGPSPEHDLPFQDLGDERWWDEQRLRPDVQNGAQLSDGRNEGGVGGYSDFGDVERERESDGRGS